MRTALALIALCATSISAPCAEPAPSAIFGQYFGYKRVCDVHPSSCYQTSDSLSVKKGMYDALTKIPKIDVVALFSFDNGHQCSFDGSGLWVKDRILVTNDDSGCELVLFPKDNEIHTVAITVERCRTHCGTRGSLDQIIVKRARQR